MTETKTKMHVLKDWKCFKEFKKNKNANKMLIKQLRDIKTFVSDKDGKLNSKKYVLSGKIFDCLFEIDA